MSEFKEELRKTEELADALHARTDLQSNNHEKEIDTLNKENAVLRTTIAKLTAKAN